MVTAVRRDLVEHRQSAVADVSFPRRIVELIVAPYDETAIVEYRGELWQELFERGAWDGIDTQPGRKSVLANRDHDRTRIVGKAIRFEPSRSEGLVADVKIAKTALGDETLALAEDDMIGVSAGFVSRLRDQIFDRARMVRRIRRASLDHIAFLGDGAYRGAAVLNVRSRIATPALDELVAWQQSQPDRRYVRSS